MLLSFFLCCLLTNPVKVLKVENAGVPLSRVGFNQCYLGLDETFLVATKYQVWHWGKDGKIINRFGQKGSGPGEFEGVGSILWNGTFYWVIDNQNLTSNIFDKNGVFLSRQPFYFRHFVPIDNHLFAVDYSNANQFAKSYPQVFQELQASLVGKDLKIVKTPLLFGKVTERQRGMSLNFKLLWGTKMGDTFYLVNQMEPTIFVYDSEARKRESATPLTEPFTPQTITMSLPHYIEPPAQFTKQRSTRALSEWWYSWSRINYFNRAGESFVVGYEIPNPEDKENAQQAVAVLGRDGKPLKPALVLPGYIIGTAGNNLYQMREDDESEEFSYYVDIYDLSTP